MEYVFVLNSQHFYNAGEYAYVNRLILEPHKYVYIIILIALYFKKKIILICILQVFCIIFTSQDTT